MHATEPRDDAAAAEASDARVVVLSIRQYGMRALVVLFILNAVDEFDRAVLALALDDIAQHFDISDFTVGLLPLAVIFIAGLLSLPAGTWADRWSRRNILVIGAMIWGSAGLFAAASRSFVQLFLTRALLGFGQGTIGPTHLSMLSDYYPVGVRGRVMNYWRSANAFGTIVAAIIGGAIISTAGWRWAFVAAAIPGLFFGLYALTLREPKRGEAEIATAVDDNPMLAEFLREPTDKKGFLESLSTILSNRTLRYLIWCNAALGFTLIGIVYWLPTLYERRYGFSTGAAAAVYAALGLAAFLGTWLGGPWADRHVRQGFSHLTRLGGHAVVVLLVAWTLAFAVPFAPLSIVLLIGSGVVASFGSAGLIPVVAACSPPRIRSQSFAAFGLALAVFGAAAAPAVVGGISEAFQRWGSVNEGDSLRYAMLLSVVSVASIGAWFVYQASRSADDDVRRVFGEFIAEHTHPQVAPAAADSAAAT
jgi:MFS family permease